MTTNFFKALFKIAMNRLPLQVALLAFAVYLFTSNPGVTLESLGLTGKIAGWDILPMTNHPLSWLVTLPLRLLPDGWIAPALNFFTAILAATTIGILARTLELMDWDRPLPLLGKWLSKLPVVFGCVLCGLELNFWQAATAGTGEILSALLLAGSILCLAQFRAKRKLNWLTWASFIWGLLMAESPEFIWFFPFFIVAVIWLSLPEFFNWRNLRNFLLVSLAGFAAFAILPLWNGMAPSSPYHWGEAWHLSLQNYKRLTIDFARQLWWAQEHRIVWISIIMFYLIPLVPIMYRTRDMGTMDRLPVDQVQVWLNRTLKLGLFVLSIWLAFDPEYGPRKLLAKQTGTLFPMLSFDLFLGLGTAFIIGNLLLSLGANSLGLYRPPTLLEATYGRSLIPFVSVLSVLCFIGLGMRNLPVLIETRQHSLEQYGAEMVHCLPSGRGIILSDDPQRLLVFQAAAAHQPGKKDWLAIDTQLLPYDFYRRHLAGHLGAQWLLETQSVLNSAGMVKIVDGLLASNAVYYLHPPYNCFSEVFDSEAHGLVYAQRRNAGILTSNASLAAPQLERNDQYWLSTAKNLGGLKIGPRNYRGKPEASINFIGDLVYSEPAEVPQKVKIAEWYSTALNDWGVQLQRSEKYVEARLRFQQAIDLNQKNLAARFNLRCNTNLVDGRLMNLNLTESVRAQFGKFPAIAWLNLVNGPVDEPSFCYAIGNTCFKEGFPRMGLRELQRAAELAGNLPQTQLPLIQIYTRFGMLARAQELIERCRRELTPGSDNVALDTQLALLEANIWLARTNSAMASSILESSFRRYPKNIELERLMLQAEIAMNNYSNALTVVGRMLEKSPNSLECLYTLAAIQVRIGQFTNALTTVGRAMVLSNQPALRLVRAAANLGLGDLENAEVDYRSLEKQNPNSLSINSALLEIMIRKCETNQAVYYLQQCLSLSPTNTNQHVFFENELNKWTSRN